ncbi:23S rRNA (guanine(745)-N(1))-methyltransferase [Thalassotalea sp. 1_MG-2023]|uniref:23S rRNA (guanine(745)-N(1))-methyltransferase n=1 Tax=Thalassotalea sp. 1_MG-2023 TaxID=3062680 RepID=UPI0026E22F50|nr:23S rRNA (guanine(745)-N(1))-methyltransferase [Thalassotalea sp. 1_MG-2023]MDO6427740.1 23S rRNA (guanine(745)-N(1))-methyltransferase [Thalassotalea sp. 1_MG-2023]
MISAQYRCPICQSRLTLKEHTYRCAQSHCFDKAKEGYVNLLPVQFKHSKQPGDNKAMVNARRAFLLQGYYQPLADKLVSILKTLPLNNGTILDAGCGEGYYTNQFRHNNQVVYGVDIAKEAVKKAAKKYSECHFSVATLSQLPFEDRSIDTIVSIYAPILSVEFNRVLSESGYLITVTPGKNHLLALKQRIYQQALQHDEDKQSVDNMTLHCQEQLTYSMTLKTGEELLNLLSMTPFAFKANEQVKQQLKKEHNFECQADFLIRIYRKTA